MLRKISIDPGISVNDESGITAQVHSIHVSHFNDESLKEFREGVAQAVASGQPFLPITIDSYGGEAYALLSMLDTLAATKMPIVTVAVGKAMSCGAILLACGSPGMRFAAPNATIMLHEVSSGTMGKTTDIEADVAECKRLNTLVWERIEQARLSSAKPRGTRKTRIKKKSLLTELHSRKNADWYLTAEQSRRLHLIDHIGMPTIVAHISLQLGLEV